MKLSLLKLQLISSVLPQGRFYNEIEMQVEILNINYCIYSVQHLLIQKKQIHICVVEKEMSMFGLVSNDTESC